MATYRNNSKCNHKVVLKFVIITINVIISPKIVTNKNFLSS